MKSDTAVQKSRFFTHWQNLKTVVHTVNFPWKFPAIFSHGVEILLSI